MKHSFPYQALRRDDFGVLKPSRLRSHRILPVDPTADSVRSLPIGKSFDELQDRNESQSPGRQCRLTGLRVQAGEHRVLEIGPSSSRKRMQSVPLGKAARAMRTVSSGICSVSWGRRDMTILLNCITNDNSRPASYGNPELSTPTD